MPYQKLQFKTNEDWLKKRQEGIGGSDVAALFEKSQWITRTDLIKQKKQPIVEKQDNAITGLGHRMERVIIEDFVLGKYESVWTSDKEIFINEKYPKLQASLDAMAKVDGEDTIIEIKFVNLFGGTKWKTPDGEWALPEEYWMQVQHYMAVFETKKAIVVAFLQELNDVLEFEVERDEAFIYQLNIESINFMEEVSKYTGEIEFEVKQEDKPIITKELKELRQINIDTKKLNIRKKELQSKILEKYDTSVKMEFGSVKGIIYERKYDNGKTTKILRVS